MCGTKPGQEAGPLWGGAGLVPEEEPLSENVTQGPREGSGALTQQQQGLPGPCPSPTPPTGAKAALGHP